MKTYDLGIMPEEKAKRVEKALDSKTYMNFRVDRGTCPGGNIVTLTTKYDEKYPETSDSEILTMALHVMAYCE